MKTAEWKKIKQMERAQTAPRSRWTYFNKYVEIERNESGVEAEQSPAELEAMRPTVHQRRSYFDDN